MATFRKSRKVGPLRFTVSPRGVSTSAKAGGARLSVNSKGEVRRTVGIPGTGIYDTKRVGGSKASPKGKSDGGGYSDAGQQIHATVVVAAESRRMPDGKADIAYLPVVEVDDVAALARFAAIAPQDNGRVVRDLRDALLMPDGGEYRVVLLVQRADNPKLFGKKDDDSPKGLDIGRLGKREFTRWAPDFDGRTIQVVVLIDATPGRTARVEVRFKPELLADDDGTLEDVSQGPAVIPAAEYGEAQPQTPPAASSSTAPAGWYPDPWAMAKLRWFDGAQWTHNVNDA